MVKSVLQLLRKNDFKIKIGFVQVNYLYYFPCLIFNKTVKNIGGLSSRFKEHVHTIDHNDIHLLSKSGMEKI